MEQGTCYVSYASILKDKTLCESIEFTFTDRGRGKVTEEVILLHVITHGNYHRGQAGQIIHAANVLPPRDIHTRFLHISDPYQIEKKAYKMLQPIHTASYFCEFQRFTLSMKISLQHVLQALGVKS